MDGRLTSQESFLIDLSCTLLIPDYSNHSVCVCVCVLWGSMQPSVESKTLATNTVV